MNFIDLHTHSTASDGTDSPSELIKKASEINLSSIALTDHDTTKGLNEAEEAAKDLGIYFIRGVEISTNSELGSMHILGLWLPKNDENLENFLQKMHDRRFERNRKIINKLKSIGIHISMEELQNYAGSSPGKPHIANLLYEKGYVRAPWEAFAKYLDKGGLAYFPKEKLKPEEAVKILHESGATVSMAHPRLEGWSWEYIKRYVEKLKPFGLDALECAHSSHSAEETMSLDKIVLEYRLLCTSGSDYHGLNKSVKLGKVAGNQLGIYHEILKGLMKDRKQKGLWIWKRFL